MSLSGNPFRQHGNCFIATLLCITVYSPWYGEQVNNSASLLFPLHFRVKRFKLQKKPEQFDDDDPQAYKGAQAPDKVRRGYKRMAEKSLWLRLNLKTRLRLTCLTVNCYLLKYIYFEISEICYVIVNLFLGLGWTQTLLAITLKGWG